MQASKFPKHINILGVRFRVLLVEGLRDEESSLDGDMSVTNGNLIRISADLNSRRKWETLVHEAIHAMFHVGGATFLLKDNDSEIEEAVVRLLESGIVQLIEQHGNNLARFIVDEHKEEL